MSVKIDKDPTALTMRVTTEINASPQRAWQLWADPRQLERWWGPPTYPATVVDHDLAPGGRVSYFMTSPEGEKFHGWWEVIATEPPNRLELKDGFADDSGAPNESMPTTVMVMTLTETEAGRDHDGSRVPIPFAGGHGADGRHGYGGGDHGCDGPDRRNSRRRRFGLGDTSQIEPQPVDSHESITEIQRLASRQWPRGWHPGGLGWALARSQLAEEVAVWRLETGEAGGWAARSVHEPGEVMVQVDPSHPEVAEEAITWALQGPPRGAVTCEVYEGDELLASALARRGFAPVSTMPLVGMFRPAGGKPRGPEGYRIRPIRPGEEATRVEVHRSAWKPSSLPYTDGRSADPAAESPFNLAKYEAVRETHLYRPELDLVVEAVDGTLAASCIAWYDPLTGCAEIEPMGVVPQHRRRGLGVALCEEVARLVGDRRRRRSLRERRTETRVPRLLGGLSEGGFRLPPAGRELQARGVARCFRGASS